MRPDEKIEFAALIEKTWRFYGQKPTGEVVADWFELLEGFPLDAIRVAFSRHLTDPDRGQYPPKPADLARFLPVSKPQDDGRPSADEAWGMLLRLARDEAETGVLSDEMREAWQACGPILDEGDEVGARRCFIAAYERRVQAARERREPARWTVTLGTDKALRQSRLDQAVRLGRIGADHARALLPGPSTASIASVAGLLEGPTATTEEREVSRRLRGLIEIINSAGAEADDQRKAEEAARRGREQAERAKVRQELAKRGVLSGFGSGEKKGEEAA